MMIEKTNPFKRNSRQKPRQRVLRRRKGSVLVLVVGVLAVLAAMALSYITVVRIDRRSTDAYQEQENLQQEVVAVTAFLQAMLTADLHGNRITNASTPKTDPNNTSQLNWPKGFEDGEYFDYPWTDVDPNSPGYTWDTSLPGQPLTANSPSVLDITRSERAFADDAWLASIEPIDTGGQPLSNDGAEWDTWTQITNLRSAYRYRRLSNSIQRAWIRGDGRFVDLGQFLLQRPINVATPRHGFPGADLMLDAPADQGGQLWREPPLLGGAQNGPALGVNQTIYDLQMADLQDEFYWPSAGSPAEPPGSRTLQPADERFWADTDGDGRPDARWQLLDALGNDFGKVWVIATRIIDNSALANVNAHINFMDYANPSIVDRIGDGRTPADVDLYRLFASQIAGSINAHPDITLQPVYDATHLTKSFREENILNGLRAWSMLDQLDQLDSPLNNTVVASPLGLRDSRDFATIGEQWPPTGTLFGDPLLTPPTNPLELELRRVERAAIWRFFGSNPLAPVATTGSSYPFRDEIDLRTFNGFNLLRTVSSIEQRFDGPRPAGAGIPGFLPGGNPTYDDTTSGPSLGPMRSKEWDSPTESPRTFGDTMVLLSGTGLYTNQEKLQRQRKDIRHLLTTVSGSGSIGPVPVLNPVFDRQFITHKVALGRFANTPPSVTNPFDLLQHVDRIRQPVTDAFAAAMWALAPLATNQPLMSPLDQIDPFAYAQLANDADLHYGGGVAGPASKAAQDQYGLNRNSIGGPDDIGAAYVVTRAAALAANIADAIDNESELPVPPATTATTTETPTMVRLFNQLDLNSFLAQDTVLVLRDQMTQSGVIPLGVRFPQGDLWSDSLQTPTVPLVAGQNRNALRPEVVGEPENGVTFVGLDRQPFLVRALTVAVYADQGSYAGQETLANSQITPTDLAEQLGSLLVIELGNPWPDPIDLKGYIARIASGPDAVDLLGLDFLSSTIPLGTTINPGSRTAFYYFQGPSGDAPAGAQDDWVIISDQLRTEIDSLGGADEVREITDLVPGAAGATGGVMFQNIGGGPVPVLLIRTINPVSASGLPTRSTEVLVDRLSPDPASTDTFPAVLTETVDLQQFATTPPMGGIGVVPSFTGRIAVQSVLRRKTLPGTNGGFPSYVVERPKDNIQNFQNFDDTVQVWEVAPDLEPIKPIVDLGQSIIDNTGGTSNASEIGLIAQEDGSLDLPAFELFVPNGPLLATSELGQISTFAHMYIHLDQGAPSVLEAWNNATPPLMGPGKWATVSEQLGWDAHYLYNNDPGGSPVGLNLNPYLGVLDFSRFILNNGAGAAGGDLAAVPLNALPDPLATPLATRLFDAFEAIPTPSDGLVRGRINVNTAPKRILELLPFVDPRNPISGIVQTIAGWSPALTMPNLSRVDLIQRYRSRDALLNPGQLNNAPSQLTRLPGLRQPQIQTPFSLGFVNSGELAILGLWNTVPDGNFTSNPPDMGFLELGSNGPSDQIPLDIRPAAMGTEAGDDPEERLAIFRAISNIVSTRSDIFTAWYILRAYDPQDIEAITIPQDIEGDDNAIVSLMNPGNPNGLQGVSADNPGLIPSFEKRVLVIFDRSNVTRPTDRPKILLQVELPIR